MVFQSSLDLWVLAILATLSLIGLARGFLREITSILNWFGSLYLTSLAKPFVVSLLKNRISTPFLLDIISNVVLFVFCMLILSILGSYIVAKVEDFLPIYVNRLFGLLFGSIKGSLISLVILASLNILYRDPNIEEPLWLKNSIAFEYFSSIDSDIFVNILEKILGDMIKEEKKSENNDEKNYEKSKEKNEDLKDIDDLLKIIVD
ncbi:MAG: CvpA family protein [Rickettsiales bacterium]|jgi:membrane protein required for colicin V production|nr:CvpA family protein [Rickettsiales bacterium]